MTDNLTELNSLKYKIDQIVFKEMHKVDDEVREEDWPIGSCAGRHAGISADKIIELIQAYAQQVATEARIDELEMLFKASLDANHRSEIFTLLPDGSTVKTSDRLAELEGKP